MSAGETLHFAGDDSIGMHCILSGKLRIYLSVEEHGSYFVHLLHPGYWFGEGPSITGLPRVVTPVAFGDCELLFLPQAAILDILSRDPACIRFFVAPLLKHFETSVGIVADLLLRDHKQRIAAVLLRLGGCRTDALDVRGRIDIEATQEEIAIMANVVRMTAGSVLRHFAKAGLIEVGYGKVTLLAPSKLRAMLKTN